MICHPHGKDGQEWQEGARIRCEMKLFYLFMEGGRRDAVEVGRDYVANPRDSYDVVDLDDECREFAG